MIYIRLQDIKKRARKQPALQFDFSVGGQQYHHIVRLVHIQQADINLHGWCGTWMHFLICAHCGKQTRFLYVGELSPSVAPACKQCAKSVQVEAFPGPNKRMKAEKRLQRMIDQRVKSQAIQRETELPNDSNRLGACDGSRSWLT